MLDAAGLARSVKTGGEIGIRTLDTRKRILDFESSAFDHSAISPQRRIIASSGVRQNEVRYTGLRHLRSVAGDVHRIERRRCRDEQAISLRPAENEVRRRLGDAYLAEQRAFGREALHAVTRARPDVAAGIDTQSVREYRIHLREHPAFRKALAADDVEDTDVMIAVLPVRSSGIDDVELRLVG